MRRPNLNVEFLNAIDCNVGGVIQDRAPIGAKIAGYMIILRGSNVGGAAVDLEVDTGQIILRSALLGDLLTEPHLGFMQERTIAKKGNIRLINTGVALSDIEITLFHDFDLSGDYTHGNIYPTLPGESLEWVLPAVDAGVMTGTWEVHRIVADVGQCVYIPRWRSRGLQVAEIAWTFDGRCAELMFMPASGVGAADPDRISIFDPDSKREVFLSWLASLAWTNAQLRYDADQANYFVWQRFSDVTASLKKAFKAAQLRVEVVGGVGTIVSSYAILEMAPEEMRRAADVLSSQETALAEQSALETGISPSSLRAVERSTLPGFQSAPIGGLEAPGTAPIGPLGKRPRRVKLF